MIDLRLGDCLEVMKTIPDKSVDLVLTDPPYLMTSRGCYGGTGGMLKDKKCMSGEVFNNTLNITDYLPQLFRVMKEKSHGYLMCNNKNLKDFLIQIEQQGFSIFKTLIWAKDNCITNMFYMDSHEYIIFFRTGGAKRINNCGTRSVLNVDNVINKVHPTEKPINLMKILINNSSNKMDIILDPFMGSGTTGVACKELGRNFIGIEIEPKYFAIAERRINQTMENLL